MLLFFTTPAFKCLLFIPRDECRHNIGASKFVYACENGTNTNDLFARRSHWNDSGQPLNVACKPNVVYL